MAAGGAIVLFTWGENYGDCSERRGFLEQCGKATRAIYSSKLRPYVPGSSRIGWHWTFLMQLRCLRVAMFRWLRAWLGSYLNAPYLLPLPESVGEFPCVTLSQTSGEFCIYCQVC